MGTVFTATSKAAEAPDIEPGFYDGRFDGVEGTTMKGGRYQKNPDGDPKLKWGFTLLDDEGAVLYDKGDPIEVEKVTGVGFNIASKTVPAELKVLKALLTADEYKAFEDGKPTPEDQLVGRIVQVEVFVKENGYLGVGDILPARKKRTAKARSAAAAADVDEE